MTTGESGNKNDADAEDEDTFAENGATTSDIEEFTRFGIEIVERRNHPIGKQPLPVQNVVHGVWAEYAKYMLKNSIVADGNTRRVIAGILGIQQAKKFGHYDMASRIERMDGHYFNAFCGLVSTLG